MDLMDLRTEQTMTPKEAQRLFRKIIGGKAPCYDTITRWCDIGLLHFASNERIKLDSFRIGRRRFTSVEAVHRFINELSDDPLK